MLAHRVIIKGFLLVPGRLDKVKIIETFPVTKKNHLTASYLGGVGILTAFNVFMKIPLISLNNLNGP
jgi:hypothetical protein